MNHITQKLFVLIFIASLLGCKEKDVAPHGSVVGFVKVYDDTGSELTDKSGVTVSLDGNHSVTTNSIGRYQFDGIESGTYKISFEKNGYGTVKRFNTQYAAGGASGFIPTINMIAVPSYQVSNAALVLQTASTMKFTGTTTETKQYYFVAYYSDKADVSNVNYNYSGGYTVSGGTLTNFSLVFSIPTNTTPLYVAMYATTSASSNDFSFQYYDYELGRYVFPASKQVLAPVKLK